MSIACVKATVTCKNSYRGLLMQKIISGKQNTNKDPVLLTKNRGE